MEHAVWEISQNPCDLCVWQLMSALQMHMYLGVSMNELTNLNCQSVIV